MATTTGQYIWMNIALPIVSFFLCHLEIKMAACNTKFLDRALWEMEKIFFGSRNLIDPKVT
jgi:hypothetical protein